MIDTAADPRRVIAIKAVHTVIFAGMLSSILWLVRTGLLGRRDRSIALAERWGAERGSVSDIFLPDALARTTPIWSSALLILAALLHLRALRARAHDLGSAGGEP